MILKNITGLQWIKDTQSNIHKGMSAQYLFGLGGKNKVSMGNSVGLSTRISNQFTYFKKFSEEVWNGELTGAQVMNRIRMYGEASTNGYEAAKAHSHNLEMPEYPADGTQDCLSKCRCHWRYEDDPNNPNYALCYWVVNRRAEHCEACLENSREWNPLRQRKGVGVF